MNHEHPVARPFKINDGYGIVGIGFQCGVCDRETLFVDIELGRFVECGKCHVMNICNETLDY
jgi:hypothetical protein